MTDLVTLTIDDRQVDVPKGTLVVDAAAKLGIEIPVFCSHPKLDPVACCRMCLVEISGPRGMMLQTACSVPVAQDMVVKTNTQAGAGRAGSQPGFHPAQPPAGLPHLRQGRRVPAAGPDDALWPRHQPVGRAKRHKKKHYLITDTIVLDQERCVRLLALHPLPGRVGRQARSWRSSNAAARRSSTSRTASRSTPRPAAISSTSARWVR